ncbi:MAG: hypothetical protein P8168_03235 [Deltaproteobacteria bacterium]|jgi:hypothetical protein
MKKLMIGAVILGLLIGPITGCQTLSSAFCSPTAEEIANATTALAQAQQMEAFLATLVQTSTTVAIIAGLNVAIGIYSQIKAGVCVSAEQETAAQEAVKAATPAAMQMGFKGFMPTAWWQNLTPAERQGFKGYRS